MTIARLYVDEDPHQDLATEMRSLGFDAASTTERGHKGRSDPWQLAFAARDQRILVTCNFKHFEMLHEAWTSWSLDWGVKKQFPHPGVLVIPSGSEIGLPETVAILVEILRQDITLANRLFRWRRFTGWLELFPAARNADATAD